ncbi:MAG: PLD nuclease N-terminal domain-containing protein [Bacillota bacterium]
MGTFRINFFLFAPLILLQLGLVIAALADIARRSSAEIAGGRKWPWVLAILFFGIIGPLVYFILGRKDQ